MREIMKLGTTKAAKVMMKVDIFNKSMYHQFRLIGTVLT